MKIVAREREQELLDACLGSARPEFVAVCGRPGVGKTTLIRTCFKDRFAFHATGVAGGKTRDQLHAFNDALRAYGCKERAIPKEWHEAFARLRTLLSRADAIRSIGSGRLVIFLDEVPWMDTARSNFRDAFGRFWSTWASSRPDVLLVACGSAAHWMRDNLIGNENATHRRITRQIHLEPFTLAECEEFFAEAGISMTRDQVRECYQVFGGVPGYLDLIDRKYDLVQNVDQLCFARIAPLRHELERLFGNLFRFPKRHLAIVRSLARRPGGLMRADLEAIEGIGGGRPLTTALHELEECGLVCAYHDLNKETYSCLYQLSDPFTLFSLRFLDRTEVLPWNLYQGTRSFEAWSEHAFELVCLLHTDQMKRALGISGVETRECAWRSSRGRHRLQADLLIDRRDNVVSMCEMRYFPEELAIDDAYARTLRNKMAVLGNGLPAGKVASLAMITPKGVAHNEHYGLVQRELTVDDLFLA